MKSRRLVPAMYQSVSPRQLKTVPFFSVRLRRALGFESFRRTPASSIARPFDGRILRPPRRIFSIAERMRSSSVCAVMYIEAPRQPPFAASNVNGPACTPLLNTIEMVRKVFSVRSNSPVPGTYVPQRFHKLLGTQADLVRHQVHEFGLVGGGVTEYEGGLSRTNRIP